MNDQLPAQYWRDMARRLTRRVYGTIVTVAITLVVIDVSLSIGNQVLAALNLPTLGVLTALWIWQRRLRDQALDRAARFDQLYYDEFGPGQ